MATCLREWQKQLVGIPWRVAFALQADGWWLRQDIIWHKPNPMPESVTDRCTKAHEYVFLLTKSERYFYDAEAVSEASVRPGLREACDAAQRRLYGTREGTEFFNKSLFCMPTFRRDATADPSGRSQRSPTAAHTSR
jgi:hypothetical protein